MTAPAVIAERIGDLLVREGLITRDQLNLALQEQRENGTRVGYNLVALGMIKETDLTRMLARLALTNRFAPRRCAITIPNTADREFGKSRNKKCVTSGIMNTAPMRSSAIATYPGKGKPSTAGNMSAIPASTRQHAPIHP